MPRSRLAACWCISRIIVIQTVCDCEMGMALLSQYQRYTWYLVRIFAPPRRAGPRALAIKARLYGAGQALVRPAAAQPGPPCADGPRPHPARRSLVLCALTLVLPLWLSGWGLTRQFVFHSPSRPCGTVTW